AAIAAKDYGELSHIAREASVVYAWRGNDRSAALELLQSLAFASIQDNRAALSRALAETGRIELEGGRYERAAMLFREIAKSAAKDLPMRQAQRLKVNFCQALNRTGNADQALAIARQLKSELPAEETRLSFLVRIEEARGFAARGQFAEAETSLVEAETSLADASDNFRRLEYLEAKGELALLKGDSEAAEMLAQVASEFAEQDLIARAAIVRVKLANALFKAGRDEEAREALALALRSAIAADLGELADRIRSDMMKSDGGKHLKELAEDIESIGGGAGVARRFIMLGHLGGGGGGQVDRALDLNDGEQVALKKVDLAAYSAEQRRRAIDSVRAEYACALSLTHPGVARVRDLLIDPKGAIYIVQEFIDGPTLRKALVQETPHEQLLGYLAGVADALAALHAKGIVHRDVKPENVVLREGSSAVLIDLGIALVAGSQDGLARMGTPPYMAPEQKGEGAVDGRADIYALGQMIAEIFGGKLPPKLSFGSFGQRPQDMPPALGKLVRLMLKEDPERRFADLKVIAETLRGASLPEASQTS
ncbi:protein kinase domain-containing protein, partial [Methyloceanibacter sp.]|uniref:protein kinase domain-containing protein n=1 Tax=Methyloceanibacter sp. TaxID=1965321 RepID=UPI002D5BA506